RAVAKPASGWCARASPGERVRARARPAAARGAPRPAHARDALLTLPLRRPRRGRLVAAVVGVAAILWAAHAWPTRVPPGRALFSFDSAEYALAGRELARTGVLATPYSYVGVLAPGVSPPYPLLAGHPLLPLLEAPVFRAFGAHAWGALVPVA